jgi:hypothetical protein
LLAQWINIRWSDFDNCHVRADEELTAFLEMESVIRRLPPL